MKRPNSIFLIRFSPRRHRYTPLFISLCVVIFQKIANVNTIISVCVKLLDGTSVVNNFTVGKAKKVKYWIGNFWWK